MINKYKDYWEDNIGKYAGFYDKNSEENILGNPFLVFLYKKFLFPFEKKYTRDRYNKVMKFIVSNAGQNTVAADIGCGSGLFTLEMVQLGMKVYALDFSNKALALTKEKIQEKYADKVEMRIFDVLADKLPQVDICIAIGVMPYINELEKFMNNVLPFTNKFLFSFLDDRHVFNKIRKIFPFLNVRNVYTQDKNEVIRLAEKFGFTVTGLEKLASGFMISAERKQ